MQCWHATCDKQYIYELYYERTALIGRSQILVEKVARKLHILISNECPIQLIWLSNGNFAAIVLGIF